jgi:hypothetical protein
VIPPRGHPSRNVGPRGGHLQFGIWIERPLVAEDTDWFEGLTPGAAKEERIIFGVWVARLVTLVTILCVVAYATNA